MCIVVSVTMLMSVFVEVRAIGGCKVVIMFMRSVTMLMTGGMKLMCMLRIHDCEYEEARWFEMFDEKRDTQFRQDHDARLLDWEGTP